MTAHMKNLNPQELQTLLGVLRDFDPRSLTAEVVALGEDWASQDAAASSLEETKKSMLAKLTLEYMEGGMRAGALGEKAKAMPVSHAELKALADPRYEGHIDQMVAARREATVTRVRYDMGKMRLELMRTLQATMRSEMRLAGNT